MVGSSVCTCGSASVEYAYQKASPFPILAGNSSCVPVFLLFQAKHLNWWRFHSTRNRVEFTDSHKIITICTRTDLYQICLATPSSGWWFVHRWCRVRIPDKITQDPLLKEGNACTYSDNTPSICQGKEKCIPPIKLPRRSAWETLWPGKHHFM